MQEVFNRLTKEIKEHDKIVIMAHKDLDLDALGSSLGMYQIIKSFEKDVFIFLDKKQEEYSSDILKVFDSTVDLDVLYFYSEDIKNYDLSDALLIVLDNNRVSRLAYPEILDIVSSVVLIDHHLKGKDYIKDTLVSYINSGLSSVSEFVVFYAHYLNKTFLPIISTILLGGIAIDTNEYRMKTGENTFLASSFLIKQGASNIAKLDFIRQNKDEYLRRLDFVKKSDIVDGKAFCVLDEHIVSSKDLAIISESLLQFDEIEAAFTIGKIDNDIVGISARSLGNIDVEKIMSVFGGGGHFSEAACQITGVSLEEAKRNLMDIDIVEG